MNKSPYINNPDILFCHETRRTRPIKLDFEGADMLPAGTLISAEGKAVNDVTALGVLLHDTYEGFGSGTASILIAGHVDLAKAQECGGCTYAAEAKAVLKNIIFVGDTEPPATGGGGNVIHYTDRIFFDGNIEGRETVEALGQTMVRLSDVVPTKDELLKGVDFVDSAGVWSIVDVTDESQFTEEFGIIMINNIYIVPVDGFEVPGLMTVPKAGIYCGLNLDNPDDVYPVEMRINGFDRFDSKMEEKNILTVHQRDSMLRESYEEIKSAILAGKNIFYLDAQVLPNLRADGAIDLSLLRTSVSAGALNIDFDGVRVNEDNTYEFTYKQLTLG